MICVCVRRVWLFAACKMDVENGSQAKNAWDAEAHVERKKKTKHKKKNNSNKRKINDLQQNLLSINLSSEAVVGAVGAVAAAHFLQNLN